MKEIMNINGVSYEIIKLLGHGKGGYSYLARKDGKQYVLKQIHHEPCDYYTFGNKIEAERNDYERLLTAGISIPKMLDIDMDSSDFIKIGRRLEEKNRVLRFKIGDAECRLFRADQATEEAVNYFEQENILNYYFYEK